MAVQNLCPNAIVEGDGFKDVMEYLEPVYKLPSNSYCSGGSQEVSNSQKSSQSIATYCGSIGLTSDIIIDKLC